MNIVNVGYDSTNYYVVANESTRLLVDAGWPGTLPKFRRQLMSKGLDLSDIRYVFCTHYHPDHAGLVQEIKQAGARLIILDEQRAAVPLLGTYAKLSQQYQEIRLDDAINLAIAASRDFLRRLGISGEIVHTPGHSEDSCSLVLDEGIAFTGDLGMPLDSEEPEHRKIAESWHELQARGAKRIYPGHGPIRTLEQILSYSVPDR